MAMKQELEKLRKASESFQKRHDLKDGMVVQFKSELRVDRESRKIGIFMYWLPNSFGGDHDYPLAHENFLIADCAIMCSGDKGEACPCLSDSRYLEPFIEEDEKQLQLEL